jgi:hypothetical protein
MALVDDDGFSEAILRAHAVVAPEELQEAEAAFEHRRAITERSFDRLPESGRRWCVTAGSDVQNPATENAGVDGIGTGAQYSQNRSVEDGDGEVKFVCPSGHQLGQLNDATDDGTVRSKEAHRQTESREQIQESGPQGQQQRPMRFTVDHQSGYNRDPQKDQRRPCHACREHRKEPLHRFEAKVANRRGQPRKGRFQLLL